MQKTPEFIRGPDAAPRERLAYCAAVVSGTAWFVIALSPCMVETVSSCIVVVSCMSVSRGPSVSCGVELQAPVVSVVAGFSWLVGALSTPTLSGVIVASPGRPPTPGGPVRVLSIT